MLRTLVLLGCLAAAPLAAQGPAHIVAATFPDGTRDAPSGDVEFTLTFDRAFPAGTRPVRDGEAYFPPILAVEWTPDGRTVRLRVHLLGGKEYNFRFGAAGPVYRLRTEPAE